MPTDDIINTQAAQSGDLAGNAGQQPVNGFQQAGGNVQSTADLNWEEREKALLAKAYQQAQSLVSKSENRQTSKYQGMIDQFKASYGVTLTEQQAQEMALNQAEKSAHNAPVVGQQPAQQAPAADPSYQGFMYYHGMDANSPLAPSYAQMYQIQNTLGVQLDKSDEEYQKFLKPEQKYPNPAALVAAWKQACIDKMVRMKAETQEQQPEQKTNLGQMPLVGSKGSKANTYDPKRTTKSYVDEYIRNMNK